MRNAILTIFQVWLAVEAANRIISAVAWTVFLFFGLWLGGFLMKLFIRGMSWEDKSSGVFQRERTFDRFERFRMSNSE